MNEEDRLRGQLVQRRVPWTIDGRGLSHFRWKGDEWTFLNLAPGAATGYQSGADMVFHDGATRIVIVEMKVARAGGDSKPKLLRQLYAYGLQAWELVEDPTLQVGTRSRNERVPFASICAEADLEPSRIRDVVLVAATLKPDVSRSSPSKLRAYIERELTRAPDAFAKMLCESRSSDPLWRRNVIARLDGRPRAFVWGTAENSDTIASSCIQIGRLVM